MANFFSGLKNFAFGKEFQNFSPEQQQLINEALQAARSGNQNAMQWLNSILSDEEGAFEDFERPYREQFEEQTIPSILERLNAGGGMNKGGSAISRQLAQAGRQFSGDLASMRAGLKNNAINQLHNFSNLGLQRKTTPYQTTGTRGALDIFANSGIGGQAGGAALDWLTQWLGGRSKQGSTPGPASAGMSGPAIGGF